ncbi:MAG: UDP-N-acetylglucosamine--N-acetylmuramyl-(pentapeptide) pyrophosphoryl-undecaprenol N-acetylglucosamine transferase [Planctomycetota bacterium]|jgi:UDP-N-acetylglucosamine--N-acetylmuramyl-(pentapeptide) pyrophosphoryl-undecaprenol N-acetylglucosamine transferase
MARRRPDDSAAEAPRTILFAGGGTGGHISPGLAIAERLAEIDPAARCLFICSERPLDAAMLDEVGAVSISVPATPPAVRPAAALRFLRRYRESLRAIRRALQEHRVDQVVALGGFVAAPAVSAAAREHIPVCLLNLDATPGKANRLMARRCDRVYSAVDLPERPEFAEAIVGMPIRRRALAPEDAAGCRARLGLDPGTPTLLITGASQGAASINRFVTSLAGSEPETFDDWQVLHLAGPKEEASVRAAYEAAEVPAVVLGFLHEMGLAWGAADLAVSRAGASSVAEAAANAVPTLFLPYPWHRDEHQRRNAEPLVAVGGAVLARDRIDASPNMREVGPVLRDLMTDHARRQAMHDALRANPPADAASDMARRLLARPD